MADVIWEGDLSTDPTVGGNWDTGVVPAVGENVIFDSTAQANCIGGDLSGVVVASVTITDDCTIDIGTSAANALDFDCNGIVVNRGSGTHYLNIKNTTYWSEQGSGIHYVDGIDNDILNIKSTGTVHVGNLGTGPGSDAEFDGPNRIDGGTVEIHDMTTQLPAAPPLIIEKGTVTTECAMGIVQETGGTYTHADGVMAAYYGDGGKCHYNSNGTLTLGEVDTSGKLTLEDDYRPVTITTLRIKKGTFLDPHARATFTNPVETPDCHINDCSIDFGYHRKYTVALIV